MSVVNYSAIGKLPEDQRLKALADAVNMELGLIQLSLDIQGGKALSAPQLNGRAKTAAPTLEQVKAYLSTKYATPGDNANLLNTAGRIQSFFHTGLDEVDLGWTNLFTLVDLRGSSQPSFDIIDASSTLKFTQRAPGEKVEINRTFGDTSATVKYVTYAGGLGILDDWFRYQQYWNVEAVITEFRAKYYALQAELHYGLFTALGSGINQAFTTDATVTFNAAVASMLRAVKDKGYGASSTTPVYILTNPERVGYINKMLATTNGSLLLGYNQNAQPIGYNVAGVIATTEIPADSTGYYVVLPGRKIQRGVWMDLSIESNRDIYKRAQDWVGTGQFNAAIGDTAQVRRVLFA